MIIVPGGPEYLKKQLKESGHAYSQFTDAPTVREFAIRTPIAVETVVERMLEEGYLAGIPLRSGFEDSDVDGSLLVSVTEKRTAKEIEEFVNALQRVAK